VASFKLKIDLNVLNHLGLGLYSSTPSIVTEIVANAWDADAKKVTIKVDSTKEEIVVEDDGHGMDNEEVTTKFLNVGYSRRDKESTKNKSRSGKRAVMGRKGIGKLAMLSLARQITIVTKSEKAGSEAIAFKFDVAKLLEDIKAGNEYDILSVDVPTDFKAEHGTRIILENLNTFINKTETFLRPRLARRFAVLDDTEEFKVELNDREITPDDRGYYKDIQFLWSFDEATTVRVKKYAKNIATIKGDDGAGGEILNECVQEVPNELNLLLAAEPTKLSIRGFIATVDKPAKLGKDDESINQISIFANGRVFQVDVLNEIGDARHFNQYIVGEVHADFLDDDNTDRATASRESVKHNDPKYMSLTGHLKTVLAIIRDQWDVWRVALQLDPSEKTSEIIEDWLKGLPDARDRKSAEKLIGSIARTRFANDDDKDQGLKGLLLQSAISGFEKLRVRRQLERLDSVTDVFSPEFLSIFTNMDDIEESHYLDITRQRLEVIEKFQELVDEKHLEKVVQKYIYKHLWLLDPTWDRITGSEEMEVTLTKYLKEVAPDTDEGARIDIAYLTSSARHAIVELKRPGVYISFDKLRDQARKYIAATNQYYVEHPDAGGLHGRIPHIDVYLLVSDKPKPTLPNDEVGLRLDNIQYMTYGGLILNARKAYQEYFDARKNASRIDKLLTELRNAGRAATTSIAAAVPAVAPILTVVKASPASAS
jgi:hypothetical protein